MVKEIMKDNQTFYICEECDFAYEDKEWAEKCEAYCKEHHSCNIEITKHAVKSQEVKNMAKYKCPKCGMEFDAPGKCTMCDVELEGVEEEKEE